MEDRTCQDLELSLSSGLVPLSLRTGPPMASELFGQRLSRVKPIKYSCKLSLKSFEVTLMPQALYWVAVKNLRLNDHDRGIYSD